ncbi:hypothetical protein LSAT2_024940 [Lamellibrachia satsuma]|nr:hypothetical protein LSAT2_024940 [Lamellibrachia satsuma]
MVICYYRLATLNENVAWTSREMLWNLEVYLNNTLDEMRHVLLNNYNFTTKVIDRDLNGRYARTQLRKKAGTQERRYARIQVRKNAGTQERRYARTQVRKNAGTQERRYARTQVGKNAGTQECRYARTQVRKNAGTQERRYARTQVRKKAGTQERSYARKQVRKNAGTQERSYARTQVRKNAGTQESRYARTQLRKNAGTQERRYARIQVRKNAVTQERRYARTQVRKNADLGPVIANKMKDMFRTPGTSGTDLDTTLKTTSVQVASIGNEFLVFNEQFELLQDLLKNLTKELNDAATIITAVKGRGAGGGCGIPPCSTLQTADLKTEVDAALVGISVL